MSKRDLDNVVLLVNKCNLTTRYPYFTLNDLDVFINKEAVPFRYSQSFKVSDVVYNVVLFWQIRTGRDYSRHHDSCQFINAQFRA